MRAPFPYVGGKTRQARWIVEHFPADYRMFVDLFAGSCAVLLNCDHKDVREVVNDLDASIINLFEIIRLQPEELIAHLSVVPYARHRYRLWRSHYFSDDWQTLSDMERAVRFLYLAHNTFSGWLSPANHGWGHATSCAHKNWPPRAFRSAVEHIRAVSRRVADVEFECLDFERVVEKYDHPETLFYVDSPYTTAKYTKKKSNVYYHQPWTEAEDRRLAAALNACQGRVIASNYGCLLLDELYVGWRRVEKTVHCSSDFHHQAGSRRTELLLMNYTAEGARIMTGGQF